MEWTVVITTRTRGGPTDRRSLLANAGLSAIGLATTTFLGCTKSDAVVPPPWGGADSGSGAEAIKALHLAIDYEGIADQFWGDGSSFQAALNPAYPEAWKQDKVRTLAGYNPDTKAADRATARQLMSAAGFPDGAGLEFEMLYPDLGDIVPPEANALRFQDQMKAVFPQMKMVFKKLDFAGFSVPQAAG